MIDEVLQVPREFVAVVARVRLRHGSEGGKERDGQERAAGDGGHGARIKHVAFHPAKAKRRPR
jgi:hypothetical protein